MPKIVKLLVYLLPLVSAEIQYDAPTCAELNTIRDTIFTALTNKGNSMFIPKAVRLAFHDCIGGCDGCLNLNHPANVGFNEVIPFMEDLWRSNNFDQIMSRADFWQLAAIVATEEAIRRSNRDISNDPMPTTKMVFKWGRKDCSSSPTNVTVFHNFIPPTADRKTMMGIFKTEFNFTEDEVTAFMGAHNLGGAKPKDSGYQGKWIKGEAVMFNNNFYKLLLGQGVFYNNKPIDKTDADNDGDLKWQFNIMSRPKNNISQRVGMMINTDVELVFDIDVDKKTGTQCNVYHKKKPNNCPVAPTTSTVQLYAQNATAFWNDYRTVFDKMSCTGYDSLEKIHYWMSEE